jgi:hypothetical protein
MMNGFIGMVFPGWGKVVVGGCAVILMGLGWVVAEPEARKTEVSIVGDQFTINGEPTYAGRTWVDRRGEERKIEGLLMISRMVQGIFDDLNPETVERWAYPDGPWDADRNTDEFVAAMEGWYAHGLLSFNINLQGGSPEGYSQQQPWHNSAFKEDGALRPEYMARLERILDRADELGMVVQLGLFYFGQDQRLENDDAVRVAVDNAIDWVLEKGYRNVIIEIANECDNGKYEREAIRAANVHELIERAQKRSEAGGRRLLVSVSYNGNRIPGEKVVKVADYLILHGNGVGQPDRIVEMVRITRGMAGKAGKKVPIMFNEDDHYDFDKEWNNYLAAVSEYASWGYFDFRRRGEGFDEGFQSVPANWQWDSSERKKAFFELTKEIIGVR